MSTRSLPIVKAYRLGLDPSYSLEVIATPAELMLHAGGQEVSSEDLARIELPTSTKTWKPISHTTVHDTALGQLASRYLYRQQ